mgnify:CR=1 FL=1
MDKLYKTVFSDGYITWIIKNNNGYKLIGKSLYFPNIIELALYYKGIIKSFNEVGSIDE